MRLDLYTKVILTVIAAMLCLLAVRPLVSPIPAQAQSQALDLYIEPGYTQLRKPDGTANIQGKIMIDRRTGNVWGFPTGVEGPYPVNFTNTEPPVSKPMLLGKFDFSAIR